MADRRGHCSNEGLIFLRKRLVKLARNFLWNFPRNFPRRFSNTATWFERWKNRVGNWLRCLRFDFDCVLYPGTPAIRGSFPVFSRERFPRVPPYLQTSLIFSFPLESIFAIFLPTHGRYVRIAIFFPTQRQQYYSRAPFHCSFVSSQRTLYISSKNSVPWKTANCPLKSVFHFLGEGAKVME